MKLWNLWPRRRHESHCDSLYEAYCCNLGDACQIMIYCCRHVLVWEVGSMDVKEIHEQTILESSCQRKHLDTHLRRSVQCARLEYARVVASFIWKYQIVPYTAYAGRERSRWSMRCCAYSCANIYSIMPRVEK